MKKTRKILAMVITMIMLFSLLPVTGMLSSAATAEYVYIGGIKLEDGRYLANGGSVTTSVGPEQGGYAYFADGVLKLNNFRYDGKSVAYPDPDTYAALYSDADLTITLVGDNTLKCNGNDFSKGIMADNCALTINGSGSLYVGSTYPLRGESSSVVITGNAEVVAHVSDEKGGRGIWVNSLKFNGKKLTVICENGSNPGNGIQADNIEFTGGTSSIASTGIPLNGLVTVSGADTVVACVCSTSVNTDTSTLVKGTMTFCDGLGIISPAGAEVSAHPDNDGFWIVKTADGGYTRSFVVGPAAAAKSVMSGTSHLKGAQMSNVYFGRYQQSLIGAERPSTGTEGVDWVYKRSTNFKPTPDNPMPDSYHKIVPVQWRVLFNADGRLLLLTDKSIDKYCYHHDEVNITYARSSIRSWLNGYDAAESASGRDFTSDNFIDAAFNEMEQAAIRQTEVVNSSYDGIKEFPVNPYYSEADGGEDTKDKLFLLSLSDAMNPVYGFEHGLEASNRRISYVSDFVASGGTIATFVTHSIGDPSINYYLRTPGKSAELAVIVNNGGGILADGGVVYSVMTDIRPALHIAPEQIILSSAAVDGKGGTLGELAELQEYDGNDWKLTVYDESRGNFSAAFTRSDTKLNVEYSGAKTGENEYISALVKDENGMITHYGRLKNAAEASGTAEIDISSLTGAGSVYVFNEQVNGDYETDYASRLIAFSTAEPEVISESGNEHNGYYEIKNAANLLWFAEKVNSGSTDIKGVMAADIDLSGINWAPIGNKEKPFTGVFDGDGYSVSNIGIHVGDGYGGFFGYIKDAEVKDFSIDGALTINCTTEDSHRFGVIGYASGTSVVSDIHSALDITVADTFGKKQIGGVVGRADGDTAISRCSYSGTIDLGSAHTDCVGGILSYTYADNKINISDCAFYGSIKSGYTGTGQAFSVGGIMGYYSSWPPDTSSNGKNLIIKNCLSAGTLPEGTNLSSGAVVGVLKYIDAENAGNFENNYYYSQLADVGEMEKCGISAIAESATEQRLASGEVAYLLGSAWGQTIGADKYPVIGGAVVYRYGDIHTNHTMEISEFGILSHGTDDTKATARIQVPANGEYTVVFADYNENNGLKVIDMITRNFEKGITTIKSSSDVTLSFRDKVMIWSGVPDMEPLSEAYVLLPSAQYVSCNGGFEGEMGSNLFDGDVDTKWCSSLVTHNAKPTVVFRYDVPVRIESYTLTTANDTATELGRNWTAWTLYGSDSEDGEWTELHKVQNAVLPEENYTESDSFVIENNTAMYQYYKLVMDSSKEGETQQMSEFTAIVK